MNIEDSVRRILVEIGEDPGREALKETPRRVREVYEEIFSGYREDPQSVLKIFPNDGGYSGMLSVKGIDYFSYCEHHMMPFFGEVCVAYIPDEKIVGISKIPRLVDIFSKRLQNQEQLTSQIAQTLFEALSPKGVAVWVSGVHMCMCSRGIRKINTKTITTVFLGDFESDFSLRSEFFKQI